MNSLLRSSMSSLFAAAVLAAFTGPGLAQDSGFVDDSPAPATAHNTVAPKVSTPASTLAKAPLNALTGFPGLVTPDTKLPGITVTPEMVSQSINSSVGALTSQLNLSSYQQQQIKSILTYNLQEIQGISSNTEENPTIAANTKNELYEKTLSEVNGVLNDDQKAGLQKMMAPLRKAASVMPSSATPAGVSG